MESVPKCLFESVDVHRNHMQKIRANVRIIIYINITILFSNINKSVIAEAMYYICFKRQYEYNFLIYE